MENIRTVVCRNFNRLVESSGKTKREIARQMSISEATLQRWKSGDSFPELPNIEKLATVLGVSAFEFYRQGEPVGPANEPVSIFAKKLLTIPDAVYELAYRLGDPKSEQWEIVKEALEYAIERKAEAKSTKKNGNGA